LNDLENTINVLQHVVVPEAQHAVAVCFHGSLALCIRSRSCSVLPAVNLHDDAMCMAGEIRKIAIDANLAAEMSAGSREPVAQVPP
jgi:hypothetical protein